MKIKYILIAFILLVICSLNLNSLKSESSQNDSIKKTYQPLLLSNYNKSYTWNGEACGQKEYSFAFSKTLSDDVKYLCEIKENLSGTSVSGSKEVVIEFSNMIGGKCEGGIYVFDKNGNEIESESLGFIIEKNHNVVRTNYKYGYDYRISLEFCIGYESFDYVDNLKASELDIDGEIRREFKLVPTMLYCDMNHKQTIKEKILHDNEVLTNSIDFNNVSGSDSGLYEVNTSQGKTYLFRGNVNNNYVNYAFHMWRIIRINEDGSIRMILDGDIGSSSWNDEDNNSGYTYGDIKYQPLVGHFSEYPNETKTDYSTKFCYSSKYIYDRNTGKYKLDGDIFCEKMTNDNYYLNFYKMYTLYSTSSDYSSSKLYKIGHIKMYSGNVYSGYHRHYVYDSGYTRSVDTNYSRCFGTNFEIIDGEYKLSGEIECNVTSSRPTEHLNHYTFLYKNDEEYKSSQMYKYTGNHDYVVFMSPSKFYDNSNKNSSNVKLMLDEWNNNLISDHFKVEGTFCNETREGIPLSFNCDGLRSFDYGGLYKSEIGLITETEMKYAGASSAAANNNYYLAYKSPYWTMTASGENSMIVSTISNLTDDSTPGVSDTYIRLNTLGNNLVNSSIVKDEHSLYKGDKRIVVRPVINIRGTSYIYHENDGTKGNPYNLNDECRYLDEW